ncbi:MAG: glutathione S-transferase family protein [Actinomycetota bacterium]|nr:glutathione S-transferase family protein [Actinomycetota bacterium]
MATTLYSLASSHPGHAARLMLERKGIEHRVVNFIPGTHAAALRPLGFRRGTVPALRLDGKRVQGSRAISRFLDEVKPEPRLLPADPQERISVEAAERWGDEVLQQIPRRLTRWLALNRPEMRVHMAREAGVPAAELIGRANAPIAWYFARKVDANEEQRVRRDVASLPALFDHVEEMIAAGTIGGDQPNAADFQIATSIRVLISYEDLAPLIEAREAGRLATALMPEYPTSVPAGFVPAEWLQQLRA